MWMRAVCSCVESEQRLARKGFRSGVNDRRIGTEGREQAGRASRLGNVGEGALKLRRAVQRVHRVGPSVDRRVGVRHVVANEPNGPGDGPIVDVGRGDTTAPFGQPARDRRAGTDANLDEVVVPTQPVDERGVHVGMFISNGI